MNIVLIGYRGTGKSTVALALARILKRETVSLDETIVRAAGFSIPEIVKRSGWDHFRDLESQAVGEISKRDNLIIDSGGGVILRDENTQALKSNGFLVLLSADRDTIVKRIQSGADRPSLTGQKSFVAEVEEVLKQRMPKYLAAADFQIDTGRLSPEAIADRIIQELKNRNIIKSDADPR
ncbi:MAG: shikimate kinase [Proteobacteria bacterium]|nr:shikimate kinase [Pseudomonadota bacterium]